MTARRICLLFSEGYDENIIFSKLTSEGQSVTVFYISSDHTPEDKINQWREKCEKEQLVFFHARLTGHVLANRYIQLSYEAFMWLRQHESDYDDVHFFLPSGLGYYSLLAKHQGHCFQHINFYMHLYRPTFLEIRNNQQYPNNLEDILLDFMERESFKLADELINTDPAIVDWMQKNQWRLPSPKTFPLPSSFTPQVSICICHFNRPAFLAKTLESIRAQDYKNFEVILVDDGSPDDESQSYLDSLEEEFKARHWKIIRQANASASVARNTAAKQANGEYLLFMDDDNYAMPEEISTFVKAACYSGADILTSAFICFKDDSELNSNVRKYHVPLGQAWIMAFYGNCFGDMNALVKRHVYDALGGFPIVKGGIYGDWEFFTRAMLKGFTLEVVPLPLFWYRQHHGGMSQNINPIKRHELYNRVVNIYLESIPQSLNQLILFAYGQYLKIDELEKSQKEAQKINIQELQKYQNTLSWRITAPLRFIRKLISPLFPL